MPNAYQPIYLETPPGRVRNRPLKDYAGVRFGRLIGVVLISRDLTPENNHLWEFVCDCGNHVERRIKNVRSGKTSSCGCLARELTVARNETHGLTRQFPREYGLWKGMRDRCQRTGNRSYADYGGRGITVCPRWEDFARFMDDMGPCPNGLSIDRMDTNGNYEPGNCRWATATQQANNKRSNHVITYLGKSLTLQQWCDKFNLEASKVRYRLKRGWNLDRAFSREDYRKTA